MPRQDRYHETVKTALVKDGWTITHAPLIFKNKIDICRVGLEKAHRDWEVAPTAK